MSVTQEDLEFIDNAETFINRKYSTTGRILNSAYYHISQPLIENKISKTFKSIIFHTIAGRASLLGYKKLNDNLGNSYNYLLSLRLNALIDYIIIDLDHGLNGLIISTSICFALVFIHAIFSAVVEKMIGDLSNGNLELFETTAEDRFMKRLKNKT